MVNGLLIFQTGIAWKPKCLSEKNTARPTKQAKRCSGWLFYADAFKTGATQRFKLKAFYIFVQ